MVFIETPIFSEHIQALIPDESYQSLQLFLAQHPDMGAVIPGSGGLRKIRWHAPHTGKRGGVRVIYYWIVDESVIYMLAVYGKSRQKDLKPERIRFLRQLVEAYLNG